MGAPRGGKTNHGARIGLSGPQLQFLGVGAGDGARNIAFRHRGAPENSDPTLVWLNGYRSDMGSTKAGALDVWCAAKGRALLRFDYSGHGASGGRFEDGTLSRWLEEALGVIRARVPGAVVLVGSSMGGYIALLAARAFAEAGEAARLAGMVLIAPAVDMTHALMLPKAPPEAHEALARDGVWLRPSAYGEPYPITRALIEDGARHLLLADTIRSHCPTRILQGMRDEEVPYAHALEIVEHMAFDPVTLTLIRDGEHRLSRPQDLTALFLAIADLG